MIKVKAKFTGRVGSLDLKVDQEYTIEIRKGVFFGVLAKIWIVEKKNTLPDHIEGDVEVGFKKEKFVQCPYSDIETFLINWTEIKVIPQEVPWNH